MRILASNPDTIGDMVLRQPMYRALREAGHELTLIVRPSVEPLVAHVAPGAGTLLLPAEVYLDDLDAHWPAFDGVFRAARELRPEALLIAPYQWTRFEERLADELKDVPGLRRFGLSGRLYPGDPYSGSAPPSRLAFDVTAAVREDEPEVEKNAALAAAVLGAPAGSVLPVEPRIEAGEAELSDARQILARLGLGPGGYWVACVTGTAHVPIKAWPQRNWAEVLSGWARQHGRQFLFVGLPAERQAVEAVRQMMGDAGPTRVWMEEGGTLSQLVGLTALSAGYAGHDTGPMHLAAALGRPVLAVFGGGHGGRFFPRGAGGAPAVALTVGVPCAGCAWTCAFETSHCVKDVPIERVSGAADDLEAGRVAGLEERVLEPAVELRDRMIREAMAFTRQRLRDAGDLSRQLRQTEEHTVRPMRAALDLRSRENNDLTARLAERESAAAGLRVTIDRMSAEAADLSGRLRQAEAEAAETAAGLAAVTREVLALRHGASARDDEAARLRARIRELELAPPTPPTPRWWRRPWRRPWRPWQQVVTDLVTGGRDFVPRRTPRGLPKITVVMPVPARLDPAGCGCPDCRGCRGEGCGDCPGSPPAAVRRTLESVLRQDYPRVDFVVAPVSGSAAPDRAGGADGAMPWSPPWFEPYRERIGRVAEPAAGRGQALAQALQSSDADVIGWLEPGDVFEPAALWHVGEFFRDHPRARGAVFEETTRAGGWRFPRQARHRPRCDVYSLLSSPRDEEPRCVFLRRGPCAGIGGIRPGAGSAAEFDLLLRFSRRHGLRRAPGQVTCVGPDRPVPPRGREAGEARRSASEQYERDRAGAVEAFRAGFGLAGRARCLALHCAASFGDAVGRLAGPPRLTFVPPVVPPDAGPGAGLEPADAVAGDGGARPLTGRPPRRLLLGAAGAGGRARLFYHDPAADVAWAIDAPGPAADEEKKARPRALWAGWQGGPRWVRHLMEIDPPTGLPGAAPPDDASDDASGAAGTHPTAREFLATVAGMAGPTDPEVSLLHAGCGDGAWLDELRALARWKLAGTEADPPAAAAARSKGYDVWEVSLADAAAVLPAPCRFDLIFLGPAASESLDPGELLGALRRLRQVLRPGGLIVLAGPNLDSGLLDLFGPAWPGWQPGRCRTFLGRRGVARLAALADLRLARFRTRTPRGQVVRAATFDRVGLGAASERDAPDADGRRRGARVTAWARLLWDWRGRGDVFCAVLKSL